jgi:hypothetical protein
VTLLEKGTDDGSIKPLASKQGPKPVKTAEVEFTMTGVTPQPAFYAKVTGTGITPIGGACQLGPGSLLNTRSPAARHECPEV